MVTIIAIIGFGVYAYADGGRGMPGRGMGYGGQGYMGRGGMGPGMMGGGMGHGLMGGGMMGPGMMGSGMMGSGMMGPGMMGRGMMGPGMMGSDYGYGPQYQQPQKPLEEKDVMTMLENYLNSTRNPNLKLGEIQDKGNVFEAEIVTKKEGSLVDKIAVDKYTGWMRSAY